MTHFRFAIHRMMILAAAVPSVGCETGVRQAQFGKLSSPRPVPAMIKLGDVPVYSTRSFEIAIVNPTSRIVTIKRIEHGCGCTRIVATRTTILPGDEVALKGHFRASGSPGPIQKQIGVYFETGNKLVVPIVANVIRELTFEPEVVNLDPNFQTQQSSVANLIIENNSENPVKLLSVLVRHEGVAVNLPSSPILAHAVGHLAVKASPHCIQDDDFILMVTTTHPTEQVLTIPIALHPVTPVNAQPRRIYFGVVSSRHLAARRFLYERLVGCLLKGLRLINVSSPPYLECVSRSRLSDTEYETVFRFTKDFPGIDLSGCLEFEFLSKNDENPVYDVKVPIHGILTGD